MKTNGPDRDITIRAQSRCMDTRLYACLYVCVLVRVLLSMYVCMGFSVATVFSGLCSFVIEFIGWDHSPPLHRHAMGWVIVSPGASIRGWPQGPQQYFERGPAIGRTRQYLSDKIGKESYSSLGTYKSEFLSLVGYLRFLLFRATDVTWVMKANGVFYFKNCSL